MIILLEVWHYFIDKLVYNVFLCGILQILSLKRLARDRKDCVIKYAQKCCESGIFVSDGYYRAEIVLSSS